MRRLVRAALTCPHKDGWFVYSCPTRDQVKRVAWSKLKKVFAASGVLDRVYEADLMVRLRSGVEISAVGLDRPERAEGRILDGIVLDEYANMRPDAWDEHIRPSLSTLNREGWALFIGTPEGRNHFWNIYVYAQDPTHTDWEAYSWKSAEVISPAELAAAREGMDALTFAQEYEGTFTTFEGLAYYAFDRKVHAAERLQYDPQRDLIFTFDFNVNPGTSAVIQEQPYMGKNDRIDSKKLVTMVIDEVHIGKGSNTKRVCDTLAEKWKHHQGRVLLYGDATGGNKHSSSNDGSDWDVVRDTLKPFFGDRLRMRVAQGNPQEKARVNALNARLKTADDKAHMMVCPFGAPKVIEDLECVMVIDGTQGELDKDSDKEHSHLSDGIGYYMFAVHPTTKHFISTTLV